MSKVLSLQVFCIEKEKFRMKNVRILPSTFRIEKVQKWKAKCLSHMNVEDLSFHILHSGSAEVEIQMFMLWEC